MACFNVVKESGQLGNKIFLVTPSKGWKRVKAEMMTDFGWDVKVIEENEGGAALLTLLDFP